MERSLTHKWSRTELIELIMSCMYKIYYFFIMIVALFHMPLQDKFQMLSQIKLNIFKHNRT